MKPPFLARIGAALTAFSSSSASAPVVEAVQKGSIAPFDRIPMIDGAGGDEIKKPYAQSVWVQSAIKKIAKPISAVPLKFRVDEKEITAAPWLNFWKHPVGGLSRGDFMEAMVGWLKLAGEAFLVLQQEFTVPFPEAKTKWQPLMLVRPDCMKAVKSDDGVLLGWEYRGHKGRLLRLSVEQVIMPKYWNPYDDTRGMSEYEAAHVATESDYLSGKFTLNIARANGDTGVIITMKEGASMDDTQQEQMRTQMRMKQEKSRRGEFASIFVPADLVIQDPKVRAPDAQFVAQRLENRHEIAIAFDVPPSMFEVMQSYSVGSASAWYQLIMDACIPTGVKVCEAVSAIASRQAGYEVEAYLDWEQHPVMQAVRRERIDAWMKLVDRGMPGETASDAVDLNLPEYPAGKIGLLPFSVAPFSEVTDEKKKPENDPALAEEETSEPVKEMFAALRAPSRSATSNRQSAIECDCCSMPDFASLQFRADDTRDVKRWKSLMLQRRAIMRAFADKFTRVLISARAEVLRKLEHWDTLTKSVTTRAAAADFIFDLANFDKMFRAQMRGVALTALQTSGEQLYKEIAKDDPWKMPQAEALEFLRARENKLSGVPQDVHDRIKDVLEAGLTNGDSLKEIASNIRSEFNDIGDKRASVIASTETAAAYGKGRQVAMKEAGIQWKQWLTSGNSNVRAAHLLMNGATVPIDEKFLVINPKTGESDEVLHPADSSGAPWNVINCHCVEIAVAKGPEESSEPVSAESQRALRIALGFETPDGKLNLPKGAKLVS